MRYLHYMLVVLTFFFSVLGLYAKGASDSFQDLSLSNYTVPLNEKGAVVGHFISKNIGALSLIKDDSGLFEINKQGELSLKKNKEVSVTSPMSFPVIVQCGEAQKSFEIVKDEFIKNRVIAHRGAWKNTGASQNSIAALQHAIEIGCEGAELDVWLTKDRQMILNHDQDLEGRIIEKTSFSDLRKIHLQNGEVPPTLEEYINLIKTQNKTRLVIELKSNKGNANVIALADSVVNLVHQMQAQAWVDYITFDYRGLKLIREKDQTAHIAFLEHGVELDLQKLDGISGVDYHSSLYDRLERLYERCNVLGLTTNVWTVNSEDEMNRFLDLGVDFITTDEPERLLKLIEARK